VLVNTMFWIIVAYFVWHSLHARVEANWFAPVYPAFAIAAAVAAIWSNGSRAAARWSISAGAGRRRRRPDVRLLIVQANTGVLSGYRRDATVRSVGVGWRETAEIEAARRASARLACSRRITAPPAGSPSICRRAPASRSTTQRIRWSTCPEPDAAQLAGKLCTYMRRGSAIRLSEDKFARIERAGQVQRKRGPLVIETYALDLLEGPQGEVLDRTPPP
jgi:hypothetical protein